MRRFSIIVCLLLVYNIVCVGCLRSGALLVNMHDDLAFLAGIGAYLLVLPATIVYGWLSIKTLRG